MLLTDIHIRSFTGSGLKPYLHSIAKLRMEVFKDYPYCEEPDLDREIHYLRKVFANKEAIGVLIFDNTTLVGASIGYPLSIEEPALLLPFQERHLHIDSYYFFADSTLLKQYRGRGMGHHFFDAREVHAAHNKKYKHVCFCVPDCPDRDPARPKDYIPLDDFWRKRGYVHHSEMKCLLPWKNCEDPTVIQKPFSFWIKDLH